MTPLPETVPPLDAGVGGVEETPIGNLPAGTRLGPYDLGRVLGRGGMGAVYEATHRAVRKRVAVKTLLPHLAASKSSTKRFLREAEAAARVRHPHTVDVTDVGVADGIPYIVMEYLEGENLAQRLEREGPMPVEVVVDLVLPVCSALVTAHAEGVIHRDLKPENIFVSRTRAGSEVVKVLDFGISHIAQPPDEVRLTQTNSVIGTPRYMSPEQTRGARFADARSDQYAVGVILYECLTSELPFDGDSFLEILQKLATKKVVPPSKLVRGIPSDLEAIVLRALSKEPEKRFESMLALARALLPFASARGRAVWEPAFAEGAAALLDASTLELRRDTTVVDGGSTRPVWPLAAAALGLVVLGGLGLAWLFVGPDEPPTDAPIVLVPDPGSSIAASPAPVGVEPPPASALEPPVSPGSEPEPATPPVIQPPPRAAGGTAPRGGAEHVRGGSAEAGETEPGAAETAGRDPTHRDPTRARQAPPDEAPGPLVGPNGAVILR